jgi:hypothetical protein
MRSYFTKSIVVFDVRMELPYMPRPGVLEPLAEQNQTSVKELVLGAIEKHGAVLRAAIELGVAPHTIISWLKRNDLEVETRQIAIVRRKSDRAVIAITAVPELN